MSAYANASIGSRVLIDALYESLAKLIPNTDRKNAKTITSIGATGFNKYVFAYPAKRQDQVEVYFLGDIDDSPNPSSGVPPVKQRESLNGELANRTPFHFLLTSLSQIGETANFLKDYSFPRAVKKRNTKVREPVHEFKFPEEVSHEQFEEGHAIQVTINRYERNRNARNACIKHHGSACSVCGLRMEKTYGALAKNFIHVHHIVPVAHKGKSYVIDPIIDLVPLCPNCHAVVHLANPPLSVSQLRDLIIRRGEI